MRPAFNYTASTKWWFRWSSRCLARSSPTVVGANQRVLQHPKSTKGGNWLLSQAPSHIKLWLYADICPWYAYNIDRLQPPLTSHPIYGECARCLKSESMPTTFQESVSATLFHNGWRCDVKMFCFAFKILARYAHISRHTRCGNITHCTACIFQRFVDMSCSLWRS